MVSQTRDTFARSIQIYVIACTVVMLFLLLLISCVYKYLLILIIISEIICIILLSLKISNNEKIWGSTVNLTNKFWFETLVLDICCHFIGPPSWMQHKNFTLIKAKNTSMREIIVANFCQHQLQRAWIRTRRLQESLVLYKPFSPLMCYLYNSVQTIHVTREWSAMPAISGIGYYCLFCTVQY
jgi:hypothetical protein